MEITSLELAMALAFIDILRFPISCYAWPLGAKTSQAINFKIEKDQNYSKLYYKVYL